MDVADNPKKYMWVNLLMSISFMSPVMTLFYLHRGLNYGEIFMLLLAVVVAMFLAEVPTGMIGDKYGRKTSIAIGIFLNMILTFLMIYAHSFIFFLVLMFAVGIVITFSSGSDEALLYDSLKSIGKEKEMNKVMGNITAIGFLPIIISAPLGAYLARDLTDPQFNLLILLALIPIFIALMVTLSMVEPKIGTKQEHKSSSWELFKSSFQDIKNSPTLVRLFINKTLVLIICSHVFSIIWQPYLQDSGVPIATFGILIALSAMLIALGNKYLEKIEAYFGAEKLFFYSALLPMIFFAAAAFMKNILFAIILYLVIRIMLWIRIPVFSQFTNSHIKSHNRATVLSALSMVDSLFDIIIFVIAGFVTNISIQYSMAFSAIIILIAILFFRIKNEHLGKEGAEEAS